MSDVSLPKQESKLGQVAIVVARVLYIGFIVVAALALPLTRELLKDEYSYDVESGTLYVPLLICTPTSVDVDGSTVSFDATQIDECYTLDFLVNACVASLFLSAFAMLVYIVIDAMTRFGKGPFKRSSLAGMSLFLTFILLQTGLCLGAVVKQAEFWEDHNQNVVDLLKQQDADAYGGVTKVSTYGNTTFLFAVAIVAFAVAFVTFVEFVYGLCCRRKKEDNYDDPQKSLSVLHKSSELNQSNDLSLTPSSAAMNTTGASSVGGDLENSSHLVGPTVTDQSGRPSWITGV